MRGQVCMALVVLSAMTGGCRTATRVVEIPRVDLELSGGNRGYLRGSPPEAADLKSTRQMVQTTIELPAGRRPARSRTPVSLEAPAAVQSHDTAIGEGRGSAGTETRHAHESTIFKK